MRLWRWLWGWDQHSGGLLDDWFAASARYERWTYIFLVIAFFCFCVTLAMRAGMI